MLSKIVDKLKCRESCVGKVASDVSVPGQFKTMAFAYVEDNELYGQRQRLYHRLCIAFTRALETFRNPRRLSRHRSTSFSAFVRYSAI